MAFDMAHSDSAAAFYLYKYIYKGHDRVHMQVPHMQSGDEVSMYEDMHHVLLVTEEMQFRGTPHVHALIDTHPIATDAYHNVPDID